MSSISDSASIVEVTFLITYFQGKFYFFRSGIFGIPNLGLHGKVVVRLQGPPPILIQKLKLACNKDGLLLLKCMPASEFQKKYETPRTGIYRQLKALVRS